MMIIYTVHKMATEFNETTQDWSGPTTNCGVIDKGHNEVDSISGFLKRIEEKLGLPEFRAVDDEPGRFETDQCEDDGGAKNEKGKWLANYSIYLKCYEEIK